MTLIKWLKQLVRPLVKFYYSPWHTDWTDAIIGKAYLYCCNCYYNNYSKMVKKRYAIHPSVRIGPGTIIAGEGTIIMGEDSYIGHNSFVAADPKNTSITIGKHCSLSHNIHIRTQKHVRVFSYQDELSAPIEGESIQIGDYVWIGANVYIGGGVEIGDNCIVGANSVVTRSIPNNSIVGGVPARMIRNKGDYIAADSDHRSG